MGGACSTRCKRQRAMNLPLAHAKDTDFGNRMNRSLEKKISIGFGAAICLLGMIALVSFISIRQFVANSRWEDHTRQVMVTIGDLALQMQEAETAGRGYVITGDEEFLSPYDVAATQIVSSLRELRGLTSDNPRQQQRLDRLEALVRQKLAFIARVCALRKENGFAVAQQAMLTLDSKGLTEQLERVLEEMRADENELLKVRTAAEVASARITTVVISGGSLLAIVLVSVAAFFIWRDITRRRRAEEAVRLAEERYRLLIESVQDYAIYMLDTSGHVASWNSGAQRIKGYSAEEIVGQHFSRFYTAADIEQGKPDRELRLATKTGRYEEEGWRLRKDGTAFWANVGITAVRDDAGQLRGFAKITRNITERKRAEDDIKKLNHALQQHAAQLEGANKELEAFCYSVSHDLRAPLRGIDGFSMALLEDYGATLEPQAHDYLQRVRAGTQRMAQLIDDLLNLSRITRSDLHRSPVNLSELARAAAADLQQAQPERVVDFVIADGLSVEGDARLLRVVLDNLLGNAWKFTAKRPGARIEFGAIPHNGSRQFFVRDNGAGFDMAYVHKLFGAFQRLHANSEYTGTGVGLATVQRIIHRHGGMISAEGEVDKGATFRFTL